MPQLINLARTNARFGTVDTFDTSTVTVEIPSIKVDKEADMTIWRGDVLTYTITITNIDGTIPATNIVFQDTIDPALAELIVDSVYVNNVQLTMGVGFTYNTTTGALEITAMPDIPAGESYEVIFRVTKA